jgi:hypothetical protein
MKQVLLILALAAVGSAYGQGMTPNKEPVPSPSDMRAERGQDRPDGQAPEDRTPSPSDLSTERPRANTNAEGDLRSPGIQDPRNSSAGGTGSLPAPEAVEGNQQEPMKKY